MCSVSWSTWNIENSQILNRIDIIISDISPDNFPPIDQNGYLYGQPDSQSFQTGSKTSLVHLTIVGLPFHIRVVLQGTVLSLSNSNQGVNNFNLNLKVF